MKRTEAISALNSSKSAILIYTPVSRYYLTGFCSSLGYLFILNDKSVLFVDGRYYEAACSGVCEGIRVELLEDISKQAQKLLKNTEKLLVETTNTVADVELFGKLFGLSVEPFDGLDKKLSELRLTKNSYEIECISKAQKIAESAFDYILGFIKLEICENEIAAELEYRMKLAGSEEASFNTIAISGEKTSMPHGVPSNRKVKSGEFVTMDFGAVYCGYHSDMTRTVAIGNITDEMKRVYNTVLKANIDGIAAVHSGIACKDVDFAARRVIEDAGYGKYFTHSTGHGVGLEIHEEPNLSFKSNSVLRENQIVTVEPGIYIPSEFGVRIEDMVVVAKNGCNNLTNTPKKLIII